MAVVSGTRAKGVLAGGAQGLRRARALSLAKGSVDGGALGGIRAGACARFLGGRRQFQVEELLAAALWARAFTRRLEHNDKVQVTVLFRGREMQHQDEGRKVLNSVLEKLADAGKVERPPMMDGKKMTALIMPNKAAKPKPQPKPVAKPTV